MPSFELFNWIGGGGITWFAPVCPARGKDMQHQMELGQRIIEKHNIDFMCGSGFGEREVFNLMPLIYDRTSAERRQEVAACYRELTTEFGKAGYGIYRTSIGYMDQVAENHGLTNLQVNRRIKQALDPNGILAPGKSGIRL